VVPFQQGACGALGVAYRAKLFAIQSVKDLVRRKEAVVAFVFRHDTRRTASDFNNIGFGHDWSSPACRRCPCVEMRPEIRLNSDQQQASVAAEERQRVARLRALTFAELRCIVMQRLSTDQFPLSPTSSNLLIRSMKRLFVFSAATRQHFYVGDPTQNLVTSRIPTRPWTKLSATGHCKKHRGVWIRRSDFGRQGRLYSGRQRPSSCRGLARSRRNLATRLK
jgi:hypothetical protein